MAPGATFSFFHVVQAQARLRHPPGQVLEVIETGPASQKIKRPPRNGTASIKVLGAQILIVAK